ncbi:dihydropteroate synthase [Bacteroidales bacterium OttesenSCG-928-I21]|nr:dihydropteroate synthase [Bacteroidales bacterium OttesenSCG-928-I21]
MNIKVKNKLLNFDTPLVMGIVNLTPDSFFSNSRVKNIDQAKKRIEEMFDLGADIIDIGAMSTRPKAEIISEQEEWDRLKDVLEVIVKYFPNKIFSIDTYRSEIVRRAVKDYGVSIVNDISGGEYDDKMFHIVADCNVPYVLMHINGSQQTMHDIVNYKYLVEDILLYFSQKISKLKLIGISDIIIDIGFGFSKTIDQNYTLLNELKKFEILESPILAGLSRKTMIWKHLNITPDEALNGTTVLNTIALNNGANILRVHDVKEAKQCVELFCKTKKQNF